MVSIRNLRMTFVQTFLFSFRFYIHGYKFLWKGLKEEIPKHFQMAAEHMRYERKSMLQIHLFVFTLL